MKKIIGGLAAGLLVLGAMNVHADGQAVYDKHCKGCHVAGVGNAPKPGDAAAWEARKAAGVDAMVQTVVTGKGAMPPKGTCATCDDASLKAAVEVLLAQ
ncbi:MAG: c-type cytochrome [Neptuniibacter sp.]